MMCYKDTTFCIAKCDTTSCHRNKKSIYYGDGPKEIWMPLALSDFSKTCTLYQPIKKTNEDNKQIDSRIN